MVTPRGACRLTEPDVDGVSQVDCPLSLDFKSTNEYLCRYLDTHILISCSNTRSCSEAKCSDDMSEPRESCAAAGNSSDYSLDDCTSNHQGDEHATAYASLACPSPTIDVDTSLLGSVSVDNNSNNSC